MINRINLNENWSLKEAPLSYKKEMAGSILENKTGWYTGITLPSDIHMPLIDAGVIKDPVVSDYSFDCEWIEQRSWWFKKTFDIKEIASPYYRLVLESLDVHADVFLNGVYLGHQASAFYPFVSDVKEYLVSGENTLLIRLTSGLEYVNDADLAEVNRKTGADQPKERGDNRRIFVRKPTYVYGWDWGPRVATVAIAKGAYIECSEGVLLNSTVVETLKIGESADIRANLEFEVLHPLLPVDATINVEICLNGEVKAATQIEDKLLCSGVNYLTVDFKISNPSLWWPNGMGEQPLYELYVTVDYNGGSVHFAPTKFGIRTVELDISRIDGKNRRFAFVVNGVHIFCKGANWIPADSVYARVSAEKYDALIQEAVNANFNMIRIWGGGIYERDEFYDACDKYGILVWQDFMFACAPYPGHVESFYDLVSKEMDYQTKRLGGRACLALFCGNNENHRFFEIYGTFGLELSNNLAPEYVRKNCNTIPYWNSSPYPKMNYPFVGDNHFWDFINADMPVRIEPKRYDELLDKFVSEYGYIGPVVRESIEEYFDGQPIQMYGDVWNHHNNAFENNTVLAGVKKHYTDKELNLDEYLLYAGLVQSLMYSYSLETFRSREDCGGGLIWMYNDCWGEVGWTIIDYYLRRKISYYGVKRALAPIKLIMREKDGIITIFGANDTEKPIDLSIKYGYTTFDGSYDKSNTAKISFEPHMRREVIRFKVGEHDITKGIYYTMPDNEIEPTILRLCDYRKLNVCPAKISIMSIKDEGKDRILEIASETYAHAVHIDTSSKFCVSDNYFDMLPGEKRKVVIKDGAGYNFKVKAVNMVE